MFEPVSRSQSSAPRPVAPSEREEKEHPSEVSFCRDLVLPPIAVAVMLVAEFYFLSKSTSYNP